MSGDAFPGMGPRRGAVAERFLLADLCPARDVGPADPERAHGARLFPLRAFAPQAAAVRLARRDAHRRARHHPAPARGFLGLQTVRMLRAPRRRRPAAAAFRASEQRLYPAETGAPAWLGIRRAAGRDAAI